MTTMFFTTDGRPGIHRGTLHLGAIVIAVEPGDVVPADGHLELVADVTAPRNECTASWLGGEDATVVVCEDEPGHAARAPRRGAWVVPLRGSRWIGNQAIVATFEKDGARFRESPSGRESGPVREGDSVTLAGKSFRLDRVVPSAPPLVGWVELAP